MPFPVKQVPLKTILNLVKKSTFNFQAVKSLNKGFFVNYPKSGKINPVRISIQPVKTILTLVKLIHFSRRIQNSVKKMHSKYHRKRGIQYFKSAVKNSVLYLISAFQLSSSMVKTIQMRQSLLKWRNMELS